MSRGPFLLCFVASLLIAPLALTREHAPSSALKKAMAVCAGRESGASCVLQHHGWTVDGMCRQLPGGTLACAPEPPPLRPSPEALEACTGQQDGATCGIAGPRGEPLAGVCRSGPAGEPPACIRRAPQQLPAGGEAHR